MAAVTQFQEAQSRDQVVVVAVQRLIQRALAVVEAEAMVERVMAVTVVMVELI
jgi:hypothetical protein|tara:strand:- start:97 stop:255 length:159 start_codon:yes stop_codon:yes gene_type:complete